MQEAVFSPVADQAGSLSHKPLKKPSRKRRPKVFDQSRATGKLAPFNANALLGAYFPHASLLPHQPPLLPVPLLPASKPRFYSLPSCYNQHPYPTQVLSPSVELSFQTKATNTAVSIKSVKEPFNLKRKDAVSYPSAPHFSGSGCTRYPSNRNDGDTKQGLNVNVSKDESLFSSAMIIIPSPPPSSLPMPKFSLRASQGTARSCTAGVGTVNSGTDNLRSLLRHR